jgi:hypothetical protein
MVDFGIEQRASLVPETTGLGCKVTGLTLVQSNRALPESPATRVASVGRHLFRSFRGNAEKTPEAWAASRIYDSLAELELAKPEREPA